jgi:hypothetical protein
MVTMMEKGRKTLYLPAWVIDLLDKEGEKYDGPGVVAAVAITAFCLMKNGEKVKVIQDYRTEEVKRAYSDVKSIVENTVQAESEGKRQTPPKRKVVESA